jgi:hypothetical protein
MRGRESSGLIDSPKAREGRDGGPGDLVGIAELWAPPSYMPILTDWVKYYRRCPPVA